MKKFILGIASILAILMLVTCNKPLEVHAATMITYDFSQYSIPEGQPTQLAVDDTTIMQMRLQPTLIGQFVDALALRYNTQSAIINKTVEVTYLTGVCNGTALGGIHIPSYTTALIDNNPQKKTTISSNAATYIDVNITTQTLTVFVNDEPTIITPIVTGNINKGNGTPTGNFSVVYKQRNRTLIGPRNSYRSFVRYWMRITKNGAVGIHDASWRGNFGGSIYLKNGSHGCINVPPAIMPSIYETIPEGTPVYVHI